MRFIIFIIISLLLTPLTQAETTFFDQDDAFIMGNLPTEEGISTGSGGCRYEWNCTNWNECLPPGKQTRVCTNIGTCPNPYKSEIEQNCTYTSPEIEEDKKLENKTSPPEKKIVDKNKTFINFIMVLIILFILLYLKKDYFKKLIKK